MIKKIRIFNFRSLENVEVEVAPLTILYGPAASGKSSLLYALLVLKNFIINPNQRADGFFFLGFMNLGGFEQCVFNHEVEKSIGIYFSTEDGEYGISLKENSADISMNSKIVSTTGKVSIPYLGNQTFIYEIKKEEENYNVNWNGISFSVSPKQPTAQNQEIARKIAEKLNQIPEYLKTKMDIAPHKRGFFKPFYSPISISLNPTSEDEVATIIINDLFISPKISIDLENIFERDFRVHTVPGTATSFFISTDKLSRTPVNLPNEGFGVNQIVYLLAKIHRREIKTILIEEPEVHLHPSIIRKLVRTLCDIIKKENKQIILTTHSQVFVISVLAAIREKAITPNDIKCYLVKKEGKSSKFEEQKIKENGQIEGGLSSFVEGELEDLKVFFEKT